MAQEHSEARTYSNSSTLSVFSSIYKAEPAEGRNEKLSHAHVVTTWNGNGHVPSHTGIQATECLGTKGLPRSCLRDE